ncbi:MAG TPA: ATP-binding protein [Anaerolineae bacterium]|nr:ATP-binding protein [Anaerolineae bacterium]
MMGTHSSLRISAELKNLALVRRFIEDAGAALSADSEATLDLLQAVDESVTNIVVHGYRGQPGEIEIELQREGDQLLVRLRDQAPPFDPTASPPPDINLPLDQRQIGGMGIYMARKLTDRMTHRLTPQGGNELTLVKTIIPTQAKGGTA